MSKKAILIIHGIGEQKPFETIDAFVRPFSEICNKTFKNKITLYHDFIKFNDWNESCISMEMEDSSKIDVVEYYWSHMTQRKINFSEVVDWLITVSKGAKSFYKKNSRKSGKITNVNDVLFKEDGEFDHFEYLVRILSFGGWIKYILKPVLYLMDISLVTKKIKGILSFIINSLAKHLTVPLVNYLGDVTLYCTSDVKSQYYEIRKNILDSAVEKSILLLSNPDYDEVIIIGHSLGSVIAYDILDRLNLLMQNNLSFRNNASKIKGLVTFGSPLDKISFFFDEQIDSKTQPIRYSIVSHLHGCRKKNVDNLTPSTLKYYLNSVKWLNFWTPTDVICGHLDVYSDVENIKLDFSKEFQGKPFSGIKKYINSHGLYWYSAEMYERIIKEFIL